MKLKRLFAWSAAIVVVGLAGAFAFAWFTSTNACYDDATAPRTPMKAVIRCDYGTAEVLEIADVEKPVPSDDEVLVRVHAAAVNPLDWHTLRGTPYIMRLMGVGLRRPKEVRMGVDFAGTVEAVGRDVRDFKPGDEVFGGRTGALAQYVVVKHDRALVHKPPELSFEQAASVAVAATTALQGLRDGGGLRRGERVLINGSSGGVGTFAVQIARTMDANVTAVCSTRNVALVRSLGANEVIDYKRADYTTGDVRYDVILDNVGNRTLAENRRVLKPDGRYVLIGGGGPDDGRWVGPMLKPVAAWAMSPFVSQDMGMLLAELNRKDMQALSDLMQSGRVVPVIDRRYPLRETANAIRYLETGRARGKVIVQVE